MSEPLNKRSQAITAGLNRSPNRAMLRASLFWIAKVARSNIASFVR